MHVVWPEIRLLPPAVNEAVPHVLHVSEAQLLLVPGLYLSAPVQGEHTLAPDAEYVPAPHGVWIEVPLHE